MTHPLVDEVMKKAPIAWLTVGDAPAYGVWCLGVDGSLYVVSGPGEQPAPGLSAAEAATVSVRGDHGGRIVTWPVAVTRVHPRTDEWDAVAPQLAAKRLNASGTAEALVARWAAECAVSRLAPAGEPLPPGDESGAAPPVPTPAANRTRKPFRLHRVRQR